MTLPTRGRQIYGNYKVLIMTRLSDPNAPSMSNIVTSVRLLCVNTNASKLPYMFPEQSVSETFELTITLTKPRLLKDGIVEFWEGFLLFDSVFEKSKTSAFGADFFHCLSSGLRILVELLRECLFAGCYFCFIDDVNVPTEKSSINVLKRTATAGSKITSERIQMFDCDAIVIPENYPLCRSAKVQSILITGERCEFVISLFRTMLIDDRFHTFGRLEGVSGRNTCCCIDKFWLSSFTGALRGAYDELKSITKGDEPFVVDSELYAVSYQNFFNLFFVDYENPSKELELSPVKWPEWTNWEEPKPRTKG